MGGLAWIDTLCFRFGSGEQYIWEGEAGGFVRERWRLYIAMDMGIHLLLIRSYLQAMAIPPWYARLSICVRLPSLPTGIKSPLTFQSCGLALRMERSAFLQTCRHSIIIDHVMLARTNQLPVSFSDERTPYQRHPRSHMHNLPQTQHRQPRTPEND